MQECLLRKSFLKNGEYLDQILWSLLEEDWRTHAAVTFSKATILH